jgi:2-keto-4-pentenoate hydratase/2-oxohepta-3-ene-1,7-dioic acid hydratase in catechol pathway
MRLFRYASRRARQSRIAVAVGDNEPVDLVDAWAEATGERVRAGESHFMTSMLTLIEEGPDTWRRVAEVADAVRLRPHVRVSENARWLCPLDRLPSLRDFLAFESHVKRAAERRGSDVPAYYYEAPVYYKGNHRSVIGPEDECPWPDYTESMDFELEMAMIVGRGGRDIGSSGAGDHVFGFTVMNDFSARDIQGREMSAWLGPAKGKDFATALGPCIVSADEVGTQPDLEMICRVNGEEWGRARTSEMHWRWSDIIVHVSMGEDVYPGDVYGSGTPGGCCGLDLGRELSPGDVVELEIERIGVLRNSLGRA